MTTERVQAFLDDIRLLGEDRLALVQALRQAVLALGSDVTEEVKYGGLLFSEGKPLCGVFSYTGHVSLEFGNGAQLDDPHRVLEGQGKLRRHIKLSTVEELPTRHVSHYLAAAYRAGTLSATSPNN